MKMNTKQRLYCALLIASLSIHAEDWPIWRGPDHNGVSEETNWNPKSSEIAWKINVGEGYTAVSVKDKRVYTMGNKEDVDFVYCLNAETGKTIWQFSYECDAGGSHSGSRGTPVINEDSLYIVSRKGDAYRLKLEDGSVVWQNDLKKYGAKTMRWDMSTSPLVQETLVFYNAAENGIALDKFTGEKVWGSDSGRGGYATPVPFGSTQLPIFGKEKLYGVNAADGSVVWDVPWEAKYDVNAADPLILGQKIFISSGYNTGRCALLDLSQATPQKLWGNTEIKAHFSSPVPYKNFIIGVYGQSGSKRAAVKCLKQSDGSVVWEEKIGFCSLMRAGVSC